jgi:tripartite-type tricarboxylate transporter receptor subunit TctC
MLPTGTPPEIVRYLHDAARATIEEPTFVNFAKARLIDVADRPGEKTRADLWQEFRQHTEILKRSGLLKK